MWVQNCKYAQKNHGELRCETRTECMPMYMNNYVEKMCSFTTNYMLKILVCVYAFPRRKPVQVVDSNVAHNIKKIPSIVAQVTLLF